MTAFNRTALEEVIKKRFFYAPSFQAYGGVAGLYDYGPPGCALQANIIDLWRKHFVLEEEMLEMDGSIMTPAEVLKTSGHVDKFTDWMVRDLKIGEIFRADHLVEAVLETRLDGDKQARKTETEDNVQLGKDKKKEKKKGKVQIAVKLEDSVKADYEEILAKIDNYTGVELGAIIRKHNIKNPETGNDLSDPVEFNLMFESNIGPTGHVKGYLRPETAQGQFLNFKRFLEFNNDKMPFASASIGRSFRNEISPRSGLLRVREFVMAEIEHYVDPNNKDHPRFNEIKDLKLRLLPQVIQEEGKTEPIELAIDEAKIVDNQTLGYFLARIQLFLTKLGIKSDKLRFRQHMLNEMAHYACDCWDAEIQSSYGWIECVGCADRSAYDLTVHSNRTKEKLVVRETLVEPIVYEKTVLEINKKVFGPKLRQNAKFVEEYLTSLDEEQLEALKKALQDGNGVTNVPGRDGNQCEITNEYLSINRQTFTEHVREYVPNVIEPSFGIGRILYSLIEHVYWTREDDEQRAVLSFPPRVAPFKCLLVPLSNNSAFTDLVADLSIRLRKLSIAIKVDDSSNSIGRRYARNDELGTPFAVTIDFQSVNDGTVTLRERDTTKQIRENVDTILQVLKDLVEENVTWEKVMEIYPTFVTQQLDVN
ncbi:6224_t:CDS:10 [Funneliformis geosporum]|uniref:glycine--tRNA ligase n=1 Tax=Funneliformis geosporum TaxID=1117311 RepID=A0A9W4WTD9_9GLOM|nr:3541_t:CDS:10 [Funneliformis geosporum]CAI2185705.1 6224_t:CDS:10 [Funneliformis geosporum]